MSEHLSADTFKNDAANPGGDAAVDRRGLLGLAGLAGVAGMALLAGKSSAGPLTPPAGPIISTGKTLLEVEPRRALVPSGASPITIPQNGSYYLTADAPGGIVLAVGLQTVTIDLNGFTAGGLNVTTGIEASDAESTVIRNGWVQGRTFGVRAKNLVLEDVEVRSVSGVSGNTAVAINGSTGVARNLRINTFAASRSIFAIGLQGNFRLIEHCVIEECQSAIDVRRSVVIRGCALAGQQTNPPLSSIGISATEEVVVSQCSVVGFKSGVRVDRNLVVEHCTIAGIDPPEQRTVGIQAIFSLEVRHCFVQLFGVGVFASQSFVIDSSLINNSLIGVNVGLDGRITGCTIDFIFDAAIQVFQGVTITDCSLSRFPLGIRFDVSSARKSLVGRCTFRPNAGGVLFANPSGQFIGPVLTSATFGSTTHPFANVDLT